MDRRGRPVLSRTMRRWLPIALALLAVGCGPPQAGESETVLPPLAVTSVGPTPILPGTRLHVRGAGFVPHEVAELQVILRGDLSGESVDFAVLPERVDDETVVVSASGQVAALLIREDAVFVGQVLVVRRPLGEGPSETVSLQVSLPVAHALSPELTRVEPETLYPGDQVTLVGSGFLQSSEGVSLLRLDGRFVTLSPPSVRELDGLMVPALLSLDDSRARAAFALTPDIFGILPGRFEGQARVVSYSAGGVESTSQVVAIDPWTLLEPVLDRVTPAAASRGQRVLFEGRGLIPPDGLLQAGTVLLLEGAFKPTRGAPVSLTGYDALALVPDAHVDNTLLSWVLRVEQGVDGRLEGLGLTAGVFTGTVEPLLIYGGDTVTGPPLPLDFQVLPPLQVVQLKMMPGFDEALEEFGLLAEKAAILTATQEAMARHYEGISIRFDLTPPEDFEEYAVAEIQGRDPNGTGLLGLDNTVGKDVDNVRFDDIIGGYNAETHQRGYAAYGGVFVGEFMGLSPSIGDSPLASPRFDEIFGPLSPLLGGEPALAGERFGGGSRAAIIDEAARALSLLVANTISHEVGHTLGLAAIEGQFHNFGDNAGWIMDSGAMRPFEERAEIDGFGPAVFSPNNRAYLERILPVE